MYSINSLPPMYFMFFQGVVRRRTTYHGCSKNQRWGRCPNGSCTEDLDHKTEENLHRTTQTLLQGNKILPPIMI